MTVFHPPCYRCEMEVKEGEWEQAAPCRKCEEIRRFRRLGFDPFGELELDDVPGLLALVHHQPPEELWELLRTARGYLLAQATCSRELLKRVEEVLERRNHR